MRELGCFFMKTNSRPSNVAKSTNIILKMQVFTPALTCGIGPNGRSVSGFWLVNRLICLYWGAGCRNSYRGLSGQELRGRVLRGPDEDGWHGRIKISYLAGGTALESLNQLA